ncbi:MAG: hypothetical protein HN509_07715 [Halobacteriovoraceae bacterium]|mgnify:FL=1|jgi:hypothetical protein|nr:hypothetical protein [Halobacteriovoraceae bacterium]MBT5094413.1 hypothetical protein [Halobacteriovoraceae bacterium]
MRSMIYAIWITTVFSLSAAATTFNPVPVEDQVKSAYGAVLGTYVGKSYKKLASGQVVTEFTFKIAEGSGIKYSEIVNKNNFKILAPGGRWQGVSYRIDGTPKFSEGEKTFLLLNKVPEGFMVSDHAMGKYNIKEENGEVYLSNSVFPKHSSLGRISLKEMNLVLEDRFGAPLEKINHDRYVFKRIKKKRVKRGGRMPASEPLIDSEEPASESTNSIWLVLLLGVLGAISTIYLSKKSNS